MTKEDIREGQKERIRLFDLEKRNLPLKKYQQDLVNAENKGLWKNIKESRLAGKKIRLERENLKTALHSQGGDVSDEQIKEMEATADKTTVRLGKEKLHCKQKNSYINAQEVV